VGEISPVLQRVNLKQLRALAMTTGLPERTKYLPVLGKSDAFGTCEGDGAGRVTTTCGAAKERSMPHFECDEQSAAIVLTD
jgi:hypothetical protein